MQQLLYEIAGKKYLLFEYPFSETKKLETFQEAVKNYNGIVQGVGEIKRGFLVSGYVVVRVLIPEEKAVEFSNTSPH